MQPNRAQKDKSLPSLTRSTALAALVLAGAGLCITGDAFAQSPAAVEPSVSAQAAPSPLAGPYRTWLDQDVHWIIPADERSAYTALQTNPERLAFITGFWQRRNPNPGSSENTFKEEHYRRIAYANQHFAAARTGWKSDRGRIYIVDGKPDSIDAHPRAGNGETEPFEVWHYNTQNVDYRFIDPCRCGEYKLISPVQ
jgi:GWxTD domain-containing protein